MGNNLDELGRAVYLSIERQQWPQARHYFGRYTALAGHDPMLTAYANGGLARADGDLDRAERYYRELLAIQPDFLPGRMELARVQLENRKARWPSVRPGVATSTNLPKVLSPTATSQLKRPVPQAPIRCLQRHPRQPAQ